MGRINQVPGGLQSLLGSTNFGDNPSELAEVTAPTLDQFSFLAQQKVYYQSNSASVNSRGAVTTIDIPDGEIWGLISVGAQQSGAGAVNDEFRFSVQIYNAPNQSIVDPSHHIFTSDKFVASAIGEISRASLWLPTTVWLQSGSGIRLWMDHIIVAANSPFNLKAMYYRLTV